MLRKPIVINSGQLQQLQAGDILDAPSNSAVLYAAINDNAGSITIGQAVYFKSNGHVDLARANAAGTSRVFGFVYDASIASGASGNYQLLGPMAGFSGLTTGSAYYLDATTPGSITVTAPTTVGQYVTAVGQALATTELAIDTDSPILL